MISKPISKSCAYLVTANILNWLITTRRRVSSVIFTFIRLNGLKSISIRHTSTNLSNPHHVQHGCNEIISTCSYAWIYKVGNGQLCGVRLYMAGEGPNMHQSKIKETESLLNYPTYLRREFCATLTPFDPRCPGLCTRVWTTTPIPHLRRTPK